MPVRVVLMMAVRVFFLLTFQTMFPVAGSFDPMFGLDAFAIRTAIGVVINLTVMLVGVCMKWSCLSHAARFIEEGNDVQRNLS